MKKLIVAGMMMVTLATPVFAADLQATTQTWPKRDVKILFCGDGAGTFTENSTIQPQGNWTMGDKTEKTTAREMVMQGWTLQSIFPLNAKQFFVVFVKN
jgi:hypothetical protein